MPTTQEKLLRLLADGAVHSGTGLATQLGITRAAVWKSIRQLEDAGVTISAQTGKGYWLNEPLELLDATLISAALDNTARQRIDALEVLWQVGSTSDHLLQAPAVSPGRSRVCLAEFQTDGRGRRGREWFAAAGHSICLSLSWSFQSSPQQLASLGLAVGAGVLRTAQAAGATAAQLKWPNDVVVNGNKLAGVLIDVQGEAGGPMRAIIGVGLNYSLPANAERQIEAAGGLRPASLVDAYVDAHAERHPPLSRNAVAAALINELHNVMAEFSARGFSAFAAEWRAADYLQAKPVTVTVDGVEHRGVVRGIAADGRLQLETDGGILHVMSGDVRVRPAGR